jgi:hypothetical protein
MPRRAFAFTSSRFCVAADAPIARRSERTVLSSLESFSANRTIHPTRARWTRQ